MAVAVTHPDMPRKASNTKASTLSRPAGSVASASVSGGARWRAAEGGGICGVFLRPCLQIGLEVQETPCLPYLTHEILHPLPGRLEGWRPARLTLAADDDPVKEVKPLKLERL
jgi:hypothetical protein